YERPSALSKKISKRNSKNDSRARRIRAAPHRAQLTIPSRERVLDFLRESGAPMRPDALTAALGVSARPERDAFSERLAAMERDGQILTDRKGRLCVVAKLDVVTGTAQGHPDGYGFVIPDDGGPDLFLAPAEMRKALHGDRVTARRIGVDRRGRPEGAIVDVLVHVNREIVGRLYEERGVTFVVAENRRINQDILVPPERRGGAKPGQGVVVEV